MTTLRAHNQRPKPHHWRADPDDHSGRTCVHCPLGRAHDVHKPERVAAYQRRLADRQHAHARRYDPQEATDGA